MTLLSTAVSKWKKLIYLTTLLLLSSAVPAQLVETGEVKDSVSYRKPFFSFYPKLTLGNETLAHKGVESLFQKVPSAADHYRKYRQQYKTALYSFGSFFVFIGAGVISFQKGKKGLTGASILLSLGSFATSTIMMVKGEANLKKAISTYNRSGIRY